MLLRAFKTFKDKGDTEASDKGMNYLQFKTAMYRCGLLLARKQAKKVFAKLDKDGSGYIDFQEFVASVFPKSKEKMVLKTTDPAGQEERSFRVAVNVGVTARVMQDVRVDGERADPAKPASSYLRKPEDASTADLADEDKPIECLVVLPPGADLPKSFMIEIFAVEAPEDPPIYKTTVPIPQHSSKPSGLLARRPAAWLSKSLDKALIQPALVQVCAVTIRPEP